MNEKIANLVGFVEKNSLDYLILHKSGKVHSVHNKGFYFFWGNELYLVHGLKYGTIPYGIAINENVNFKEICLEKYMMVYCSNLNLFVPESGLVIKLKNANNPRRDTYEWKQNVSSSLMVELNINSVSEYALSKSSSNNVLDLLFKNLEALFNTRKKEKHSLNKFCEYCFNYLFLLVNSIIRNKLDMTKDALSHLIGLGTGLTPLMDDVILGMFSSLFYLRKYYPDELFFVSTLGRILYFESKGKTTLISEMYLQHASKGERFKIFDETTYIIMYSTDDSLLQDKIDLILSIGSNSGKGMLLGIIIGIKILLKLSSKSVN